MFNTAVKLSIGLNLGSFILLFRLESIPKCFDF